MGRPKGSKNKPKTTANTRARSSSKAQEYDAPLMGDEAAIIITFAVSLFLFLSNLGLCGPIGAALKAVQLGLFGVVGYIFPIVLSFVVAFILSNIDNPHATLRMTSALFMLVFLSALLQLFTAGGVQDMTLMDFYSEGAELGIGGGIVGGALAMVLHTIAGTVGAALILIVASFVCLIYTTGKPLARIIAKHSARAASHARDRAREDFSQVAESARLHREERRLAREEELRARRAGVDMQAIDLSAHQSLAEMSAPPTPVEANAADQTTARKNPMPEDAFTIPALDDTASYEAALGAGADVKQPALAELKLNAEPTITVSVCTDDIPRHHHLVAAGHRHIDGTDAGLLRRATGQSLRKDREADIFTALDVPECTIHDHALCAHHLRTEGAMIAPVGAFAVSLSGNHQDVSRLQRENRIGDDATLAGWHVNRDGGPDDVGTADPRLDLMIHDMVERQPIAELRYRKGPKTLQYFLNF